MNKSFLIKDVTIYGENGPFKNAYLKVSDGIISEMGEIETLQEKDADFEVISFSDHYSLLPGFIDVHIHGAGGADTMDATPEALIVMAETLPREGTTSFLATTITQSSDAIEKALENAAQFIKKNNEPGKAEVLGIHLEGPFISPNMAGAQPKQFITSPDTDTFKKWQELASGHIRLVTLAPEQEGGIELTKYLKDIGVIPSIGHSEATYRQVLEAVEAGVSHATHLFNQMRGLHHREPGVVGAVYLRDEIMAELIADTIHVSPEMINISYRLLGKERLVLITDALRAKCLKNGIYDLGGQEVTVSDGKAQLKDGTLAGSILKMNEAIIHMLKFTDANLIDLVEMTSENPARELNIFNKKGSIAKGKDADLVILDENYDVVLTMCRGKIAYQK